MFRTATARAVLAAATALTTTVGAFTSLSQQRPSFLRTPFRTSPTACQAAETSWPLQENDTYHYEKVELPSRAFLESHAIFGQLLRKDCIERYEVYKRISATLFTSEEDEELVLADIQLGSSVDGHKGIVHGGILSLLLDDSMGFGFGVMGIPVAFTANLDINYRAPVLASSRVIIRVRLSKREGRKLYFTAQMTSPDASVLYVEATSLYIIPREK